MTESHNTPPQGKGSVLLLAGVALAMGITGYLLFRVMGNSTPAAAPASETTAAPTPQTQVGTLTLAQTAEEQQLLRGFVQSRNEAVQAFDKMLPERFAFIRNTPVPDNPDAAGDAETITVGRNDFRRGLYFASIIRLANGQTILEFMTQCSKELAITNSAEVSDADAQKGPFVYLQYFPVLKNTDSGAEVQMQLLLDRIGDKVVARSPLFSSDALTKADFLTANHLACAR